MASTNSTDRAGDIIRADAWTKGGMQNFLKNPIILFNHNYDTPIGKATALKATDQGLEMEAVISKASSVYGLVKDGVLGAFSVGFRIKDADYIEETGGLDIKDAELFEVSVVSVPCNQDATFSLAKSFNSEDEYKDFINTFKTNSVNLADQSLADAEVKASTEASDTPEVGENPRQEIQMDQKELEAFAKKVADDTARKIALEQAQKEAEAKLAAEKAQAEEAAKKAQEEVLDAKIKTNLQSGTEKLLADVEAKLQEKDSKLSEVMEQFQSQLKEKEEEIHKINASKRVFSDRSGGDISTWGRQFMEAHLLGIATGKGMNTDFAREIFEKAGVDYTTSAGDIDQEIANQIEKEVTVNTVVADLFKTINVNGFATVLPIQPDVGLATWQALPQYDDSTPEGILESQTGKADDAAGLYRPKQVIMNAYRLVSTSFLDDDTDEKVLISIMPMLVDGVARAHARAVEGAIINGTGGNITGLDGHGFNAGPANGFTAATGALTAANLMTMRKGMGKYGLRPQDVVYIVPVQQYYNLVDDAEWKDMNLVGTAATKLKGAVGQVYGSEVIVSDEFVTAATGTPAALAVNVNNYVIPRLRNIRVERDREVGKQRNLIVASQALGFTQLVDGFTNNEPCIKWDYTAS